MQRFKRIGFTVGLVTVWFAGCLAAHAMASGVTFEIAAGSAATTLKQFAAQAHVQLLFDYKAVQSLKTPALRGKLEPSEALKILLQGSGFTFRQVNDHTMAVMAPGTSTSSLGLQEQPPSAAASSSATGVGSGSSDEFRVAQADQGQGAGAAAAGVVSQKTSDNFVLQEVIVTAQKRSERLEDVPVAVTVLDAASMLQQHQLTLQDYYATVPGLSVSDSGTGRVNITMRGLSTGGLNPTVGITIDDVPIGPSNTATINYAQFVPQLDPGDLQQIEFLKGPQGTLYGASSLAGVMRYVTAQPDLASTSGHVDIDGNTIPDGGSGYGVRGGVNVPLIADTLAMRVSAFDRRDPGYVDDPSHGESNVNTADVYGAHAAILWQATDRFTVRLAALFQRLQGFGDSTVDTDSDYQPVSGELSHSRIPGTGGYVAETQLYSANLNFHADYFDVTSITAYGYNRNDETVDAPSYGGIFADGAIFFNNFHTEKFSQEVRLTSPTGSKFEWQLGGFYTNENNGNVNQRAVSADSATGALAGEIVNYYFPSHYEEYAGFVNATYHFTDRFGLQFGARESHNTQRYHEVDSGYLVGPVDNVINERSEDSSFTYLVTPEFKISDSVRAYARIASGYQAGGPNASNIRNPAPPTFGPSTTVNYELGLKARLFDRRLSIDADVFDVTWRKIQLAVTDPVNQTYYILNGGDARSTGVEFAADFQPVEEFQISLAAAYTDAKLTSTTGNGFPGVDGDPLPFSSKFSASLTGEKRLRLSDSVTGFLGATAAYVGRRYEAFPASVGSPQPSVPSYGYGNLRLGAIVDTFTVTAYVKNITNERGILSSNQATADVWRTAYITPRTVGLSIAMTF